MLLAPCVCVAVVAVYIFLMYTDFGNFDFALFVAHKYKQIANSLIFS